MQAYLATSLKTDQSLANPTCRPATHQDIEVLAELLRDAIQYQESLTSAFQLRNHINWQAHLAAKLRHSERHIWVVERDGHIVAFVELRFIRPLGGPRPWAQFWGRGSAPSSRVPK